MGSQAAADASLLGKHEQAVDRRGTAKQAAQSHRRAVPSNPPRSLSTAPAERCYRHAPPLAVAPAQTQDHTRHSPRKHGDTWDDESQPPLSNTSSDMGALLSMSAPDAGESSRGTPLLFRGRRFSPRRCELFENYTKLRPRASRSVREAHQLISRLTAQGIEAVEPERVSDDTAREPSDEEPFPLEWESTSGSQSSRSPHRMRRRVPPQ